MTCRWTFHCVTSNYKWCDVVKIELNRRSVGKEHTCTRTHTHQKEEKKISNPFTFLFMSHSMINSTSISQTERWRPSLTHSHRAMTSNTQYNSIVTSKIICIVYGNQICVAYLLPNDIDVEVVSELMCVHHQHLKHIVKLAIFASGDKWNESSTFYFGTKFMYLEKYSDTTTVILFFFPLSSSSSSSSTAVICSVKAFSFCMFFFLSIYCIYVYPTLPIQFW